MCARIIAWHGQVHIFDAEQFLVSAVHWKKATSRRLLTCPWSRICGHKPLIPTALILPSAQIPQLIDAHDDDGHHGPGNRRDDLANMELWMVCTSGAQVVHMHKLVETNAQDFSSQVACLLSIHLLCAGQD